MSATLLMRLRCEHLGVEFGSATGPVRALHNLSFETREGEFLAFVGPSGCGKTSLLRVLAGITAPTSGRMVRTPNGDGAARALLVAQEHNLFPWMTMLENAAFGLEMQGISPALRHARAHELLGRLGFAGREKAYPNELSLGMKQRVAVARCFLGNPAVMLMDEPFSALDCQTRMALQQELLRLWESERKTVVFVTHDVDEAILLSDRILVLSDSPGTVVAEFTVPLPRPRPNLMTEMNQDFLDLRRRVFASLELPAGIARALCDS